MRKIKLVELSEYPMDVGFDDYSSPSIYKLVEDLQWEEVDDDEFQALSVYVRDRNAKYYRSGNHLKLMIIEEIVLEEIRESFQDHLRKARELQKKKLEEEQKLLEKQKKKAATKKEKEAEEEKRLYQELKKKWGNE